MQNGDGESGPEGRVLDGPLVGFAASSELFVKQGSSGYLPTAIKA